MCAFFWWIRGGLLSPAGSVVISLPVVVSASHRSRKNSLVFCDDCHTVPLPSSPTGCGRGRFQPGSTPFTIICQTKKVSGAHLFCLVDPRGSPLACGLGQGWLYSPPDCIHLQPGSTPFTIICQTKKVSDAHLFVWWIRGESNPCPKIR